MVRFDAYSATTQALFPSQVVPWLMEAGGQSIQQGRGFHTFSDRVAVRNHAGDEIGAVMWGGKQGRRIMVEVKGESTPEIVQKLRSEAQDHRCTRVDSCVDIERPGAFEELLAPVMEVKAKHRLYGERRGDWDQPHLGRTQYLGANSSTVRARLYEKGRQPEFRHLHRDDLVRLEIQVRPMKDAKDVYSTLSPLEIWGASKWTRQLAEAVLSEAVNPHPPGTVRKESDMDRKLRWMVKQYGPTLVQLFSDLGSWECVGLQLRDAIRAQKESR